MNSSWAIDPYSYHMMIVGDQGKAILYNAGMGAPPRTRKFKHRDQFAKEDSTKKAVHTKRVPVYVPKIDQVTGESDKWIKIRNWFTAHSFSKTEPHFVNIVKYSKAGNMFITSTNFGEVKLWDNESCQPIGIVN